MQTAEKVRKAFKYLFPTELETLKELTAGLPSFPTIVNIGAGAGTSGLAFYETRPDVMLFTIDIQDEDSPFGCLFAERKVFFEAGYGLDLDLTWRQIRAPSAEVGESWQKQMEGMIPTINLVFVDGDHSYEGCMADLKAWWPLVRKEGYMAIHDYKKGDLKTDSDGFHKDGPHPKEWVGVDQAVDEFFAGQEPYLRIMSLIVFKKRI